MQSLIDSGKVVPVETVALTNNDSFRSHPIDQTMGNLNGHKFWSLLDVHQAHREGIRPIPARMVRDNVLTIRHRQWAIGA